VKPCYTFIQPKVKSPVRLELYSISPHIFAHGDYAIGHETSIQQLDTDPFWIIKIIWCCQRLPSSSSQPAFL